MRAWLFLGAAAVAAPAGLGLGFSGDQTWRQLLAAGMLLAGFVSWSVGNRVYRSGAQGM